VQLILANQGQMQSQGEEIANSISHGLGLVGALIGTPFLIIHAVRHGDAGFIVGTIVFAASMILLYLASTLYHAWPVGRVKHCFRILEHSAIFILIAGTYTPLTLGILRGAFGWTLFGMVWGLAIAGIALKSIYKASHPILSTALYLVMGWLAVMAVRPLLSSMPTAGLFLLIAGGLSYTVGVAFFATDSRISYGHLIWHLFVITGTTCHYFLVLWYAA
jgi:hemolysin III